MHITLIHPHSANPAKNSAIWPPLGLCRIANFFFRKTWSYYHHNRRRLKKYRIPEIIDQCKNSDIIGIGAMTIYCHGISKDYENILKV